MISELESTAQGQGLQDQFISALRSELQEYGELLQLFTEQQNAILNRDPDAVLSIDTRIDAQFPIIREHREERESVASRLAAATQPPAEPNLKGLLPLFREPVRPLVEALAAEVNQLVTKARRRAQQNRTLLARSIEVTQDLLEKLNPSGVTRTYSALGKMKIKAAGGNSRLLHRI